MTMNAHTQKEAQKEAQKDAQQFAQRATFSVKNLGPIQSGEFTAKPLTLFCGPNNTGKTWLMYALYAFWRNVRRPGINGIQGMANALRENGIFKWDIQENLGGRSQKYINKNGLIHPSDFSDTFNVDESTFEHSKFNWKIAEDVFINTVRNKTIKVEIDGILLLEKHAGSTELTIMYAAKQKIMPRAVENYMMITLSKLLLSMPRTFLMPAERNGLHLFFRELSTKRTALLHHASKQKINLNELFHDVIKSRYAQPIADYIDWLNNLPELKMGKPGHFHALAEKLRRTISEGRYLVSRDGDISFRPNKLSRDAKEATPPTLGLHATSSTIKSLFGFWFYLENQAKPGDVLMIDEPELHLHPKHQRELARIFAQLVNAGLRVIVSTHSDYLVREINSLIMLATDNPARDGLMEKHGYQKEHLLDKEMVAAYLVDNREITAMEITSDEGILEKTFDDVIDDLNEIGDDIYYTYLDNTPDEDVKNVAS